MPELNDPEWGLCDHGPYLPADYRDDEEDYDEEWDEADGLDESDAYGEWDGYDDEAEVEALARLAAKIEPGRATVAQWAQAIRRLGAQRRSRAALSPAHPLSKTHPPALSAELISQDPGITPTHMMFAGWGK